MKLFIAIWRQSGGCDYTIGCGIAVHTFQAENLDDAIKSVVRDLSSPDLADDTAGSEYERLRRKYDR